MHAEDIVEFAQENNVEKIVMRRGHASKLIWELRDTNLDVNIVDGNGVAENHLNKSFRGCRSMVKLVFSLMVKQSHKFKSGKNFTICFMAKYVSLLQYQISENVSEPLLCI